MLVGSCFIVKPSLAIQLNRNQFGDFTLLVYDSTSLVLAGMAADAGEGVIEPRVIAEPADSRLRLTWLGGACSHRPTLTVQGDLEQLRLVLDPDPPDNWLPLPVSCPAVGLTFTVTVALSEPVEQDAIELELS